MAHLMSEQKTGRFAMWTAFIVLLTAVVSLVATVINLLDQREKAHETIRNLQAQLQTIGGTYEWQWAGDRWIGGVTISNDGNGQLRAATDLKQQCRNGWVDFMKGEGPVHQENGGLRLEISAQVTNHDWDCNVTHTAQNLVTGFLQPTVAFAGPAQWTENGKQSSGDMVLVRYTSSRRLY